MKIVFWISVLCIVHTFIIYPITLKLLHRYVARKGGHDSPDAIEEYQPTVSIIVAAYNEEKVIEEKLKNLTQLDYDPDKMEIIIASDNSTDDTNKVVMDYIKNHGQDIITFLPLMVRERVQVWFYEKIRTKKKVYRKAEGIVGVSIEELLTPDIISVFTRDKEIMDSINNISDKLVISPARCYIGHSYNAVEFIWIPIKEQKNSVLVSKGYDRQNAKKSSQFIAQLKEDKEQLLNLKEKVNKAHEAIEKLNAILSELEEEEAILKARIDEKIKVSGLVGMNYIRYHRGNITKLKKSLEINGRKMERACDMITMYSKNKEVMETEMEERTKDFLFNLLSLTNQ
jgi:glycosyltransferase involved in cell wall biosynthesis